MNTLFLLLLSISPGVAVCLYIFVLDKYEPEPKALLVKSFMFGAACTLPAYYMETFGIQALGIQGSPGVIKIFVLAFGVVAFSEELVKFLFLRGFVFKKSEFNEPLDGIVYAVVIGMGFATMENVVHVMFRGGGVSTGVLRMFTAIPAHAAFAVLLGYYAGLAKRLPKYRVSLLLTGFVAAVLFHGAYDFFIFQPWSDNLRLLSLLVLVVAIGISGSFVYEHRYYSWKLDRREKRREVQEDATAV